MWLPVDIDGWSCSTVHHLGCQVFGSPMRRWLDASPPFSVCHFFLVWSFLFHQVFFWWGSTKILQCAFAGDTMEGHIWTVFIQQWIWNAIDKLFLHWFIILSCVISPIFQLILCVIMNSNFCLFDGGIDQWLLQGLTVVKFVNLEMWWLLLLFWLIFPSLTAMFCGSCRTENICPKCGNLSNRINPMTPLGVGPASCNMGSRKSLTCVTFQCRTFDIQCCHRSKRIQLVVCQQQWQALDSAIGDLSLQLMSFWVALVLLLCIVLNRFSQLGTQWSQLRWFCDNGTIVPFVFFHPHNTLDGCVCVSCVILVHCSKPP